MATITVRFRGICCFLEPTNGEPFKKRVVLPNGKGHQHSELEEHLPIIEFYADDLEGDGPAGLKVSGTYTRPGDDAQYRRISIDRPMMIEMVGTPPGDVMKGPGLKESTIHLDTLLDQKFELKRSLLGEASAVNPDLVHAVIDLPKGLLMPGPPEHAMTRFLKPAKFQERRLARWLEHTAELDEDQRFGLKLTPLGDRFKESIRITFKESTRLITIAHEPLNLIVGKVVPRKVEDVEHDSNGHPNGNGNGSQPQQTTGHFDLYWDLIANPPESRPVPAPTAGGGPGCGPLDKP